MSEYRVPTPSEKILFHINRSSAKTHVPDSVNATYSAIANELQDTLPDGPEKTAALRKLLESKDCAIRSFHMPTSLIPYDCKNPYR